jgi:hypothetical protein
VTGAFPRRWLDEAMRAFGSIEGRNLNVERRVDREVRVPAARSRRRRR